MWGDDEARPAVVEGGRFVDELAMAYSVRPHQQAMHHRHSYRSIGNLGSIHPSTGPARNTAPPTGGAAGQARVTHAHVRFIYTYIIYTSPRVYTRVNRDREALKRAVDPSDRSTDDARSHD